MSEDKAKGIGKQVKGDLKEEWGEVTGDEETKASGKKDKTAGKMQEVYGKAKDKVRDGVNKQKERHDDR